MSDELRGRKFALRYFLRGLLVPVFLISSCSVGAAALALFTQPFEVAHIEDGAKIGAFVGYFLSAFGVFDIVAVLILTPARTSREFTKGLFIALGYATVWALGYGALSLIDPASPFEVPLRWLEKLLQTP